MKVKNNLGITSAFLATLPAPVTLITLTGERGDNFTGNYHEYDFDNVFELLRGNGKNKVWIDINGNTHTNSELASFIRVICKDAEKEGISIWDNYGESAKWSKDIHNDWDRSEIDAAKTGRPLRCNTMGHRKPVKKNTGNRMKKQYQDMIGITPKQFVKNMKRMF